MATNVVIVDSGGANIASLQIAFERLGVKAALSRERAVLRAASHVILPGVGAAAGAMARLQQYRLAELIPTLTQPVLGICLGMQLLAAASEEDGTRCLGVLPQTAHRLTATPGTPVPHMGWARVRTRGEHPLFAGIDDGSWFYFVHSYALPTGDSTIAVSEHGRTFCAAAAHRNFHATQFHPERSAASGVRILQNFLELAA